MTKRLIGEFLRRPPAAAKGRGDVDGLTHREREVLASSPAGCRTPRSPPSLIVGEATVKSHVAHLLMKLQRCATASRR